MLVSFKLSLLGTLGSLRTNVGRVGLKGHQFWFRLRSAPAMDWNLCLPSTPSHKSSFGKSSTCGRPWSKSPLQRFVDGVWLACAPRLPSIGTRIIVALALSTASGFVGSCAEFTTHSLRFKTKVMFGHKLRYEIKVTFGEISLKLRQTNWTIVRNNVLVVADELPSQMTVYICLTIDIWTRRRQHTSTRFYVLRCHPPKMAGFQWNWRQEFLALLCTPLGRRKLPSESYAMHTVSR